MKYYVTVNGKRYEVDVVRADAFQAAPAAAPVAAPAAAPVVAAPVAAPAAPAAAPAAVPAGGNAVPAPMPGTVLDIKVAEGASVSVGQTVIVLEAMKMEVEVVSDVAGTVKAINVKKGDVVTTGQALAVVG